MPKPDDDIKPYRLQLNFTGGHRDQQVIEDIYDGIVEDAQRRGVFFEYGFIGPMEDEDVIPGSPLDEVISGVTKREDDRLGDE